MKKIYNKLVRDKMINIYKYDVESGERMHGYSVKYLKKDKILDELKNKLQEEITELKNAYLDEKKLKEEIGDVLEVIDAILYHNNIQLEEVLALRDTKKEKRGGFETGLFLESIDYFDGKEPK